MNRPFVKMNGLGNDFIIVPDPDAAFTPDATQVCGLARRDGSLGCDQLISIVPSARAHAAMRIWNADGQEVEHCGNAARCVSWLLMEAYSLDGVRLATPSGVLTAHREGPWRVSVDMGEPRLDWRDVPIAAPQDTLTLPMDLAPGLPRAAAVSMGNPHATFFVADLEGVAIETLGPHIERAALFPNGVNVGFAEIRAFDQIRLRVWERGAGLTKSCGTGACAALVNAARRGLTARTAVVSTDGGDLRITWSETDNRVRMAGPVSLDHTGRLPDLEFYLR